MPEPGLAVPDAFEWLATQLEESLAGENPYKDISFRDFFFDIFALSYPGKNFDTWHVHLLIEDIERAFKEGLNFCGVLPRYHLKSTIGGYAVAIWRMLTVSNAKFLYLSYKDGLARYHLGEIKRVIRDSPILSKLMKDLTTRSLATCRYAIPGTGVAQVLSGGVLSFKRGLHCNAGVVADDVLRDPQNPLNLAQLLVVERHVRAEIANIPEKGVPMLVLGTPMHAQDILFKLKNDAQFIWRFLPALKPNGDEGEVYGDNEVLWKHYDKAWLADKSKSDWNSFQTEFLLTPATEIAAFFTREELGPVLRSDLLNHSLYVPYSYSEDDVEAFAGYDVGKKRHPSHLAVFMKKKDGKLRMIHQSFHDRIDYQEQARRLTLAVENFGIRRMLIDNTRAEMEERGLPPECILVSMSSRGSGGAGKLRKEAATFFGKYVSERRIEIIDEVRCVTQIICVGSDLQSPETMYGHGESYWSIALAILGHEQVYGGGGLEIGSLGFLAQAPVIGPYSLPVGAKGRCPNCGSEGITYRRNGGNCWKPSDADEGYCLECRKAFPLKVTVS